MELIPRSKVRASNWKTSTGGVMDPRTRPAPGHSDLNGRGNFVGQVMHPSGSDQAHHGQRNPESHRQKVGIAGRQSIGAMPLRNTAS
jgi:hypothetical protein